MRSTARRRLVASMVAALLLTGCASGSLGRPGDSQRSLDDLRAATEAVEDAIGDGWARRAPPSTMSCGTLEERPGRRWVDEARGRVDPSGVESELAVVIASLRDLGLDAFPQRGDAAAVARLVAIGPGRPLVVLTVQSDGGVVLQAESSCFDS